MHAMRTLTVIALVLSSLFVSGAGAQQPRTNLLELANGAVITSVSSSYGGSWSPLHLADGTTRTGWCSAQGEPLPHSIVFELPQVFSIAGVTVDTSGDQESGYPGLSAKTVVVYGSTTSSAEGFSPLGTIQVPRGGRGKVEPPKPVVARWLRFDVTENWGNAEYTEIMEMEAYGTPSGPPPDVDVTGVYETNYGALRLLQEAHLVWGCYYEGKAQIVGSMSGRVLQAEWRENEGRRTGTVVMVLSSAGDALNGVWYEHGALAGEWSGNRAEVEAGCTPEKGGGLAQRLASQGRAVLYGIYFDSDSATIKPESQPTLDEVLAVLKTEPSLKLQVAGHTDSTNTDAYNLQLSQRRAESVVRWLTEHGVTAERLTAKGYGKSQPVADNATASGRALNRRVEVSVLK
jgi:outer membrane protein OmpA-like peptidoglycan-associated protein